LVALIIPSIIGFNKSGGTKICDEPESKIQ
jgi:hypothetical protein